MQTPPPPPPIPSQPAPGQVNCKWCSKPMSHDSIRCNSCGKLRKDIYEDKIKCYVLCIIGGFMIGIGFALNDKGREGTWLLVLGVIIALGGLYFYARVSQKLKSWWWA